MQIPSWLESHLDEKSLNSIEVAVARAEKSTSAELVPMIVHRSISTGHIALTLFLLYLIFIAVIAFASSRYFPSVPIFAWEVLVIGLAGLLTWLTKGAHFWQRVLTPINDQRQSVLRRAQLEFYQSGIKATEHSTGVLIFVSLLEHQAVVLADKAISDQLPAETWTKVIEHLVRNIKDRNFEAGLSGAVEQVGKLLQEKFPIRAGDKNELHNHLIIKD